MIYYTDIETGGLLLFKEDSPELREFKKKAEKHPERYYEHITFLGEH